MQTKCLRVRLRYAAIVLEEISTTQVKMSRCIRTCETFGEECWRQARDCQCGKCLLVLQRCRVPGCDGQIYYGGRKYCSVHSQSAKQQEIRRSLNHGCGFQTSVQSGGKPCCNSIGPLEQACHFHWHAFMKAMAMRLESS